MLIFYIFPIFQIFFFLGICLLLPDELFINPRAVNFWLVNFLFRLFENISHHGVLKSDRFLFHVVKHDSIWHILKRLEPLLLKLGCLLETLQNIGSEAVIHLEGGKLDHKKCHHCRNVVRDHTLFPLGGLERVEPKYEVKSCYHRDRDLLSFVKKRKFVQQVLVLNDNRHRHLLGKWRSFES